MQRDKSDVEKSASTMTNEPLGIWNSDSSLVVCILQAARDAFTAFRRVAHMVSAISQLQEQSRPTVFEARTTCRRANALTMTLCELRALLARLTKLPKVPPLLVMPDAKEELMAYG